MFEYQMFPPSTSLLFLSLEAQVDIWQLLLWMCCISSFCSLCLHCPMTQKSRSLENNFLSHAEPPMCHIPTGKSNRAYEQAKARLPGYYAAFSAGVLHVLEEELQQHSGNNQLAGAHTACASSSRCSIVRIPAYFKLCQMLNWNSSGFQSRKVKMASLLHIFSYSTAENMALVLGCFLMPSFLIQQPLAPTSSLKYPVSHKCPLLSVLERDDCTSSENPSLWEDFKAILCSRKRWG